MPDPENLVVSQEGNDLRLNWDASPTADVVDYQIHRRNPPTAVNFNPDTDTPHAVNVTGTTYLDTTVAGGTTYEYQIFGRIGVSAPSDIFRSNDLSSGGIGETPDSSNSAAGGDAFDEVSVTAGHTLTYQEGGFGQCLEASLGNATGSCSFVWNFSGRDRVVYRHYMWLSDIVTNGSHVRPVVFRSGGVDVAAFAIHDATNELQLRDGAGFLGTDLFAVPAQQWVRVELSARASTGEIEMRIYLDAQSIAADATHTATVTPFGAIDSVRGPVYLPRTGIVDYYIAAPACSVTWVGPQEGSLAAPTVGPGNPPTANFTYSPLNPEVEETITFDGTTSFAQDGKTITGYEWIYVTGGTNDPFSTDPTVNAFFTTTGSKEVRLVVTDSDGLTAQQTRIIEVVEAPTHVFRQNDIFGEPGTTVTAANSVDGGDPFTVVSATGAHTITYESGGFSTCIRHDLNGGSGDCYYAWNFTGRDRVVYRHYMWLDSTVSTASIRPVTFIANGLQVAQLQITSGTSIMQMRAGDDLSDVLVGNASTSLPTQQWIRIEFMARASTGQIETRIFTQPADTIPQQTLTATIATFPQINDVRGPVDRPRDGIVTYFSAAPALGDDWVGPAFGSGSMLVPTVETPPPGAPTANFTFTPSSPETNETITFDGTSSTADAPATITGYQWHDVTSGVTSIGTGSTTQHAFSSSGSKQVRLTVTDSETQTATQTRTVSVSTPSGGPGGGPGAFMFGFTAAQIQALPTSGSAWNNLVSKSNQSISVNMGGSISSMSANTAFACGLRYVRTGDNTFRNKVISAIDSVVGASTYDYQATYRQIAGYAMAAELVDYKPAGVMNFFDDIRYQQLSNLSRWQSIWHGAWDCSNNHGTLARAAYTACCLFIGDMSSTSPGSAPGPSSGRSKPAGFNQAVKFLRGFIGNRSQYSTNPAGTIGSFGGFSLVSSGSTHNTILTWTDLGSSNWKPIAPASDRNQKNGGVISDISRSSGGSTHMAYSESGGVPNWDSSSKMYQYTGAQGFMADAVMVAANWSTNLWTEENSALHRWRSLMARYNGDHTHPSMTGWLDPLVNAKYGTNYPHDADGGYGFGFTDWLYQN